MPDLFIFLLKVNAALLLFCAGYYLVLRHLTFYTLNRIYLITAIVFATVYPKINLSGFAERHQQIAKPVQAVILNWQAPAEVLAKPNYWRWAELLFWAGVILLALRLTVQLYSLYKLYRNSTAAQIHNYNVRIMSGNSGPFSFWKSIYINPTNHEPEDLRSILLHEQIHVNEWHTLDALLAELSTIFYWFNPGVWLMKKAVRENIEFITDRKILKTGTDSKQYQYSLVNVSFSAAPQGIVNHFNISTIKKRIIMMNAKRSSKFNLTRYAFLVPAVVVLLLVFSISKAALVKKAVHNVKTFSLLGNKMSGNSNLAAAKTTATNPTISGVAKKSLLKQKMNVRIADTIKKGKVSITSNDAFDSANIVINGVKASKADFKKIDPNDIEEINVVSPGVGIDIVDNLDKKKGTAFVTTKGSEAGKKFKEKLDNLNKNRYTVVSGNSNMPIGNASKLVVVGTSNGSDNAISGDDSDNVAIAGSSSGTGKVQAFDLVTTNSSNVPATVTFRKNSKNEVTVRGYASGKARDTSKETYFLSIDTPGFRSLNSKPMRINYNSNATLAFANPKSSINHLSDKMIIINGKIASEADLKKISAFDIDRMVLKTDDETKELYGDKAKNGVVFIVTKKGTKEVK